MRPILGSANKDELYSEPEVRAALKSYAAANSLAKGEGEAVQLDRLLLGNLFNKKEDVSEGDSHPLNDLAVRLLAKLQLFHRVVRNTEQVHARFSGV